MKSQSTTDPLGRLRSVRYFSLALIVAGLMSSSAYALDLLGPPGCNLHKGQFEGGIEILLGRQDLDTDVGDYIQYVDGIVDDAGPASLDTLENFETFRTYATIGYCPYHSWEIFARLGGVTGELNDEFWSEGEGFESDRELAIGGGIRKTFFEEIALKIGGIVQASWSRFDGQLDASHWPAPHFLEIDLLEVQVAVGATYMFSDRFSIYGGPFAHLIYGDVEYVYSEEAIGDLVTWKFNWDIEDDPKYGAFFGTRIMLNRDCSLNIECLQTGNVKAIAASLMLRR